MVYWDHNATAPLLPSVKEQMKAAIESIHGNANSIHQLGQEARGLIEEIRNRAALFFACKPSEIIFTSSATEANFLALWNLWLSRGADSSRPKRILASSIEHSSIHENLAFFREKMGAEIIFLPLTSTGLIDIAKAEQILSDSEFLFCTVIGAHNETGIIQPWKKIAELCAARGIPFHSDLVQCVGRLPIDFKNASLTSATLAFHKMGGPKGLGILIARDGLKFEAVMRGGAQEKQRRPGTENLVAIAGLGGWLNCADQLLQNFSQLESIRNYFESEVLKKWPTSIIIGSAVTRLANTSYILFEGIKTDALLMALSFKGICASSGSACSSGMVKPSRALLEMGFSMQQAQSSIRFSLGSASTKDEAHQVIHCLDESLRRLAA